MKTKTLCLSVVLLLVLVLPLIGACATPAPTTTATPTPTSTSTSTPTPTVKKPDVVNLYAIFDLSGPYAGVMAPARDAFNDACEYVNTVQGGIRGVPVKFNIRDNGGKTDMTVNHYSELRTLNPKPYTLFLCVSTDGEALHDRVAEDKIPTIATPTQKSIYPAAYSIGWWPTYDEQFGAFLDWVKEGWKESRPPKVAILTWDNALGRAILSEPALAYAKKIGIDIVAQEIYKLTDLDASTQLIRIRTLNPDWIFTSSTGNSAAIPLKSAADIGYKVKFAQTLGWGEDSVKFAGADLAEGLVATFTSRPWDDTNAASIKILNEWYTKKNRNPATKYHMSRVPWYLILTAAEGIGKAVDKVGWDKLDGPTIKEQYTKITDFRPLGDLTRVTWTADRPCGRSVFMMQVQGGKQIPITDWRDSPYFGPTVAK